MSRYVDDAAELSGSDSGDDAEDEEDEGQDLGGFINDDPESSNPVSSDSGSEGSGGEEESGGEEDEAGSKGKGEVSSDDESPLIHMNMATGSDSEDGDGTLFATRPEPKKKVHNTQKSALNPGSSGAFVAENGGRQDGMMSARRESKKRQRDDDADGACSSERAQFGGGDEHHLHMEPADSGL